MRSFISKRSIGLVMIIINVLAMAAGLGLSGYNLWDNYRAGIQAYAILETIIQHQEETAAAALSEAPPDFLPDSDRELPVLEVDGHRYKG